ncbi:TPA: hypothetical protein ACI7A4_005105, partial [Escherichia coli]
KKRIRKDSFSRLSQRVRIADCCPKTCTEVHVVVTFKQGNVTPWGNLRQREPVFLIFYQNEGINVWPNCLRRLLKHHL